MTLSTGQSGRCAPARLRVLFSHVCPGSGPAQPASGALKLASANGPADKVAADVEAVKRAVEHCNADHADAVLDMSKAFTGLTDIEAATMLSIDRLGFDVVCQTRAGSRHWH